MYQIFAYVQSSSYKGEVSGMLLYPTVDVSLDESAVLSGKKIFVRTLNLNQDFDEIKKELLDIRDLVA
jgi:5-methylcytosine-specific restriction enzyme subunit McrC